ncbi:MAG: hypothetical protein R3C18_21205 [Planctomycetaceae bacterium]
MESFVWCRFTDEEKLREWYGNFTTGEGFPECMNDFELSAHDGEYSEGQRLEGIPHTTLFDCGYFCVETCRWSESIDNLINALRKEGGVRIDVYYQTPLVDVEAAGIKI